jgi:uncharacterized protein YyaL (SSP411 family)
MANRLSAETSPYLQQHAGNPVDWYAWGSEALERSRREDKPILLSIGYSACHWCHVMARESFEDAEVAAVMNRLFINIKVDREERPDLDQIYQLAHQMLARRTGGWPLTMFLTPAGEPFFGGTYFPKTPRHGLPGFAALCERIAELWRDRRAEIGQQSEQLAQALASTLPEPGTSTALDAQPIDALLDSLAQHFDAQHGGFGRAPKFPHPSDLELCLRAWARRGDARALEIATKTLSAMCDGGIFDQLGGGFARYSVDAAWQIPHFEKMLYDNGPLLALLADAWVATQDERFARCAQQTAEWLLREMQSPEGGFYSSLDADSEHEEGKFYVWSRDEVKAVLGDAEYALVAPHYGLDQPPNFENRHWHLHVAAPLADGQRAALDKARTRLLAVRDRRIRPGRDEKVLVSWNALAIRGLAHAGRVFNRPDWISSARRALDFIRARMWRDGRLLATYKDGRAQLAAYLDDHAFLAATLLEMLQADFSRDDLDWSEALGALLIDQFEDPQAGGFFFTARDHEQLIHRPKPGHDNATASGNATAVWVLNRLAALSGEARYARSAQRALRLFLPSMRTQPAGFAAMAIALDECLHAPRLLVLRGEPAALALWAAELAREPLPDVLVLKVPDGLPDVPPLLDKPRTPGPVNGWLCQDVTCLAPLADLSALKRACKQSLIG